LESDCPRSGLNGTNYPTPDLFMDAHLYKQKLFQKAEKSREIIRQAIERFGKDKIAVSWSGNFESILLLHLIKQEYGDIPLPVVHFDSSMKKESFNAVRDKIVSEWNLDLVVELMEMDDEQEKKGEEQKLAQVLNRYGWQALIIPAIGQELSKEREDEYFFKLDNPSQVTVKPILHFNAADIQYCMEMYGMHDSAHHNPELGPRKDRDPAFSDGDSSEPEDPDQEEEIKRRLRDLGYL
jgi:3'-phosphoadenosine 5'-phosphosulfate sulfotransferase (PAPS reductase)/FAD synthetase